MVHLHPGRYFFAGVQVVDDDVTGKQFGHAGGVVLHEKLFQLNRKRQFLQQDAVGLVQHSGAGARAFGDQQVGTKGGVVLRQAVLGRYIDHHAATAEGTFAVEQHLSSNHQVAIEQPTQTHQHDGAVRGDVAQLVGRSRLGRHHPAIGTWQFTMLQLNLPAPTHQHMANAPGRQLRRLIQAGLRAVPKGLQALGTYVFFVGA